MPARPVRKTAIKNLAEFLVQGPVRHGALYERRTPQECGDGFMLWLNTWIMPNCRKLIPELAKAIQDYERRAGLPVHCLKCGKESGHYSGCSIHEDDNRG